MKLSGGRSSVTFALLLPVLFALLVSASLAGCRRAKVRQMMSGPTVRYFELMSKTDWDAKDKREFVELFTIRGLNQMLASHGIGSFADFERKRNSIRPWKGAVTLVQETADAPAEATVTERLVSSVWQASEGAEAKYVVAQLVQFRDRLHDVQVTEALHSTTLTLSSLVIGLGILCYLPFVLFSWQKRGWFTTMLFGALATTVVRDVRSERGFKGVFLADKYAPLDEKSFTPPTTPGPPVGAPYPGLATGTYRDGIQEVVAQDMSKLSSSTPVSQDAKTMARSFRERALEQGARGAPVGYQQAIVSLYKSLAFQNDRTTAADLAYYFSRLGQSGVNPELNFLRAEFLLGALATVPVEPGEERLAAARGTAIRVINYVNAGRTKEAEELKDELESLVSGGGGGATSDRERRDERILEARYLLEKEETERGRIVDELIRASPSNPTYYNYKGLGAFEAGKSKLAEASFERAIAINPAFVEARLNLKKLQQLGKPDMGIGPSGVPRWEPEPQDFPLRRAFVFTDLMSPPLSGS